MIVIDIDMPQNCCDCPCCQEVLDGYLFKYECGVTKSDIDINSDERRENCPLKEYEVNERNSARHADAGKLSYVSIVSQKF